MIYDHYPDFGIQPTTIVINDVDDDQLEQLLDWLMIENVSYDIRATINDRGYTFIFTNGDDAMRFKLVWGGK